jgi:tetratricopeptide (TPR) repeat protein
MSRAGGSDITAISGGSMTIVPKRRALHSLIAAGILCVAGGVPAAAQSVAVPAAAQVLTLTTANAQAADELRAAINDYFMLSWASGAAHAARALQLDPDFGLARLWHTIYVGGPMAAAERQRAVRDASTGSAAEALLVLAASEASSGRAAVGRQLMALASQLVPDDRMVALWTANALADTARITALRAHAAKHPTDVGSRIFLVSYLSPLDVTVLPEARANEAESMRLAGEAIRAQPNAAGSHTAMAQALHSVGRDAEALQHLGHAAALQPRSWVTYDLMADIHTRDGKWAEMAAALDTVVLLAPGIAQKAAARRQRAGVLLGSGDVQRTRAELNQLIIELEAINATGQLRTTHLWAAVMAAGARDTAVAMRHLAAAKALEPAPGVLADNEVILFTLLGNGPEARRAVNDYVRINMATQNLTPAAELARTQNIHRVTGLALLAEKKPQEAIAELQQGGPNPYSTLGTIEAYRMLRNTRQANAVRAAFFARREWTSNSSAVPIIRYRTRN